MTAQTDRIVTDVALALFFGFLAFLSIKRAEDPARMLFKWLLTGALLFFVGWKVFPSADAGGIAAFSAIATCMLVGLVLVILWRHDIGGLIAKPFTSLYDGGDVQPEPQPFYSIARARQKQGRYQDAVAEIRKQLERFPTDFEGQMLMAEIQAQDLKNLSETELTIQTLCAQPGHAPKNIAFALYSLADWQLKYRQDTEAAQRAFQQIIDLLPDTEFALTAAQRIAHLAKPNGSLDSLETKKFVVKPVARNLGLVQDTKQFRPKETEPGKIAAELVKHLEQHPLDTDVRERLATIYADHYQRLDLAADQLEQMIQLENQPHRQVVRWLNLLADLQLRSGSDYETVKQTLQRIVDLDPSLASAETARKRIALLKLEVKSKAQNQTFKLGTYEQNIGLKASRGSTPGSASQS